MDIINIKSRLFDYSVEFVENFSETIKGFSDPTALVVDSNVLRLYKDGFKDINEDRIFVMDAVESKKNMNTAIEILEFFQKIGLKKNWKVLCFGGGITQDVTTMAADLYLRNVDWYFFPTTLLAMSDSCIGGKSSINFNHVKNQIGVFYPPKKIFIDTNFIGTLTNDDYLNGWGELFKFSLVNDPKFYEEVKSEKQLIPCERIGYYIHKGLNLKKTIIEEDEFDLGIRRTLNFGHTFGHALEAYTENAIPHGKGVLWGIDVANFIAWKKGLIDESYYLEINDFIRSHFIREEVVVSAPERLFNYVKSDKKVKGDILNFALLDGKSHLDIYPIKLDDDIYQIFVEYLNFTHQYFES